MNVALWAEIRRLIEVEKLSQRAVSRRLHCCGKTVSKALGMEQPPTQTPAKPHHSILDPYHSRVDALIKKYSELSAVRVLEEISKGDQELIEEVDLDEPDPGDYDRLCRDDEKHEEETSDE